MFLFTVLKLIKKNLHNLLVCQDLLTSFPMLAHCSQRIGCFLLNCAIQTDTYVEQTQNK